jgi:hypothetical protein
MATALKAPHVWPAGSSPHGAIDRNGLGRSFVGADSSAANEPAQSVATATPNTTNIDRLLTGMTSPVLQIAKDERHRPKLVAILS